MTFPDPFNFPPVVMALLKRTELLDLLRHRINPVYMPSNFHDLRARLMSSRPKYNSKPDYWPEGGWQAVDRSTQEGFFTYAARSQWPGYFVWNRVQHTPLDEIHAMIPLQGLSLIIGLHSLEIRIYLTDPKYPEKCWVLWDNEEDELNVDRIDLIEKISHL